MNGKPFFALYCESYVSVRQNFGRLAAETLVTLAAYSNRFGCTSIGVGRLAALMQVADDSARDVLALLESNGLLMPHWVLSTMRGGWIREGVQLKPSLVALTPDDEKTAWALWNEAFRNVQGQNVSKESHPPYNPPSQPPSESTASNHHHHHHKDSSNGETGENSDYANHEVSAIGGQKTKSQKRKKDKGEKVADAALSNGEAVNNGAKRRKTYTPHVPPHPPLPPGFVADSPLPDEALERFAQRLPDLLSPGSDSLHGVVKRALSVSNARRYVARYGESSILAAIQLALDNPNTVNPIGVMDWLLRCGINPDEDSRRVSIYEVQ